jgi:hypothetical protein
MNDKKFMELLNLYLDREVSADDALRLEAEVASSRRRREVYDQYCRMQKACSMLADKFADGAADADRKIVGFPSRSGWRMVPLVATMAAAACVVAVLGLRYKAAFDSHDTGRLAANPVPASGFSGKESLSFAMTPVFSTPLSSVFAVRAPSSPQVDALPALDTPSQDNQLSWIGGIHMTPVFPAATVDFSSDPAHGLKPVGPGDLQGAGAVQEPVEMTAFRFQR